MKNNRLRLGDILIKSNKVTEYQLNMALQQQKVQGKKLGEILIANGVVTEDDIVSSIESQTGIKQIDLNNIKIDEKAIALIPQGLCEKYTLIPFGFEDNKIKVAMSDPLNIYAIDDIAISTGFEMEVFISKSTIINNFINIYYSSRNIEEAAKKLSEERLDQNDTTVEKDIDEILTSPVVQIIDSMFKNAMEMRVSDIHIEPFENEVRIRYRIDGRLKLISTFGVESLAPLITRIKILAGLNIAEKRIPQDGRLVTKVGRTDVDMRVSVLPVVFGEKIVIRILDKGDQRVGREYLGMSEENLNKIDRIISNPYGMVLVTGPTGSGKSTTLYTLLSEINSESRNIITVEDPVEYTLTGVNQVNVNNKAGLTFASGLRSILRQDPDIVMIGEIRDGETAEISSRAAITGHLVFSTLHTNDAPSTVVRLIDMGLQPYLVSTSLVGIIAQRLVRRVCPRCKESYMATNYEKNILGIDEDRDLELYKGKGCSYCNDTGYKGRAGVYEVMEVTREIREAIGMKKTAEEIRDLSIKSGMTTLSEECKKLVIDGITTVDELATITLLKAD